MTIISGKPLLRTFKPHIHSWFQAHIFSTNKSHPRSCLNRATWEHEKHFPGTVPGNVWESSWKHCKKFLGTKIYLPGSKQLKGTICRNFSWNPIFLHGIKRRFLQCSQEHSPESKPQVPGICVQPARGQGGGVGNCLGDPWTTKEFHWTTRSICHVSLAMLVHSVRLARFQTPTIWRPLCWWKTALWSCQSEDSIPICTRCNLELVTTWP